MAINKVPYGATTPGDITDWQKQILVSQANALIQGDRVNYDFSSDTIKQGTMFILGGVIYITDSDTAISGASSDYVKLVPSGDFLIPSYVSSLSGVTFNETYNNYVDASNNGYIFDEYKAFLQDEISELKTKTAQKIKDYTLPETLKIGSGDTITLGYHHYKIITDTSLGDLLKSLPAGVFNGQKIHIVADGTGVAEISGGNGVYTNNWFITQNTGGLHAEWVASISEWRVTIELTAEYSSSNQALRLYSNGEMEIDFTDGTKTTSTPLGSIFGTSTIPVVFAKAFTQPPTVRFGGKTPSGAFWTSAESVMS